MEFKKEYLKQFRKIAFEFNDYLGDLTQEEFNKVDQLKLFKQKLDDEGLVYP